MEMFANPLTPWFLAHSALAAAVLGGVMGGVEAYYEQRLKRPAPWGRLFY